MCLRLAIEAPLLLVLDEEIVTACRKRLIKRPKNHVSHLFFKFDYLFIGLRVVDALSLDDILLDSSPSELLFAFIFAVVGF